LKARERAAAHGVPFSAEALRLHKGRNFARTRKRFSGADKRHGSCAAGGGRYGGFLRGPATQARLQKSGDERVTCSGGVDHFHVE
jgi:hypothetical protein